MKLFMKILVSSFLLSLLMSMVSFESTCTDLQRDVLRLHIIANSDSESDQQLKLSVRDKVLSSVSELYCDVDSKAEAKEITKSNVDLIEQIAADTVRQYGFDYEITVCVTEKFFDTRYYDDFTMPAGVYDTLQITIGQGKGKNWWCVMYPALCVGAASEISMKEDLSKQEYSIITANDIEYKFKIVEYFEKISELFR